MLLSSNEAHIFTVPLTLTDDQQTEKMALLSVEEIKRAKRYHFAIHKMRFIAARAALRELLSRYLNCAPQSISFLYDMHGKPYQTIQPNLHFNLSHSEDLAVYGFTLNHPIGIDIEKVQPEYHPDVAKRFFSEPETKQLFSLSPANAIRCFYRIWAKKEALVKAVGKGLAISLSSFTVSIIEQSEIIQLPADGTWLLRMLAIHEDYESVIATHPTIDKLSFYAMF